MSTRDGRWIATDYDYFAGPEASKGWAPEYIDRLSIPDQDQALETRPAWTLGEVVTALLRAGLGRPGGHRAPGGLVGRPPRRATRGAGTYSVVVLDRRGTRRLQSPCIGE